MSGSQCATAYIVGAGPGDPDLLTMRACELLGTADAVVVDRQLARTARALVRPGASVVEVDPNDERAFDLVTAQALAGRSVVRLRLGDPYLLGRGGEDAMRCRAAKVPFEVVAGVPSAVAACVAAGVPVTHRDLARSATFAIARPDRFEESWIAAARSGTLVLTLRRELLGDLASFLIDHGMPASQPCTAIEAAATSAQRSVDATIGTVPTLATVALGSHAELVLAIGPAVELREHLAWFEERPLFGSRVALTRAREQSLRLTRELTRRGAAVVHAPSIGVSRLAVDAVDAGVDSLDSGGTVVFTSRNGVDLVFQRLAERGMDARAFGAVERIACVGEGTAAALAAHGLAADVVPPPGRRTATGLLESLLELPLFGTRCTIFRAQDGDERLPAGLRSVNVDVLLVPVYRTVAEPVTSEHLDALLGCDVVTFTSASTVTSTIAMVGDASRLPPCVTIGPVTTRAALDAGLRVAQQAEDPSVDALADAVERVVTARTSDR